MKTDKAIEEIRAVRQQISAEHGHDTKALLEHYRRLEEKYAERLLRVPGRKPTESAA